MYGILLWREDYQELSPLWLLGEDGNPVLYDTEVLALEQVAGYGDWPSITGWRLEVAPYVQADGSAIFV